jgi:hypothetical protein
MALATKKPEPDKDPGIATTLRRGLTKTECSMSSDPVHRSIPPTKGTVPTLIYYRYILA